MICDSGSAVDEKRRARSAPHFETLKRQALPVAPSASSATTSIATAALSTASAAPTPAVTSTPSAPTTAAFLLRARFVHNQCAPQKILSVQRFDRFHRLGIICNFSETESARLIRETIPQKRERIGLDSNLGEHCRDLFFRSLERQITEIQFLHDRSPLGPGQRQNATEKLKKQDFGRRRPSGDGPHPV
jgi:hypothetical protein